jgi:alpha-ketoglutarate-dependent taurine dioxygenase
MLAEKTKIVTSDLAPLIGTEIKADAKTLLSGVLAKDIRALLEQRGVLLFRNVHFTAAQQVAFTRTLGTQEVEHYGMAAGQKEEVFRVSLDPRVAPTADGLRSSFFWHLDGSMHDVPILASILTPQVLSPTGGQTEFCNTYAAYEALPDSEKKAIDKLKVVHANWARANYVNPEPSYEEFKKAAYAIAPKAQPLVWTHRSGRKSLVIGGTAAYVVGLEPLESMELLVKLRDWATQPQFVYHHEWAMGDVIMWDNTGTLHRALRYDPNCGRLMHRTMLAGEEPFA